MSSRRFLPGLIGTLLVAAVIVVLPLFLSDTHEYRFSFVATFFIAVLGLQILTGYAGLISLGQSGFMLVGAYVTTILSVDHGWNDLSTIPLAFVIAGAFGFLFGFPALRLRGVYLALATFAIPIALIALTKKYSGFTGGGGGKPLTRVLTGHQAYVTTWPIAGAMFVLAWLLLYGKLGRAFRTIRESEIAAVSSGINLTTTKTLAFGISAAFAGVAGSLYAIIIGFVNPDTFAVQLSLLLLIGVVVGGVGSLAGALGRGALHRVRAALLPGHPALGRGAVRLAARPEPRGRLGRRVSGSSSCLSCSWRRPEPQAWSELDGNRLHGGLILAVVLTPRPVKRLVQRRGSCERGSVSCRHVRRDGDSLRHRACGLDGGATRCHGSPLHHRRDVPVERVGVVLCTDPRGDEGLLHVSQYAQGRRPQARRRG